MADAPNSPTVNVLLPIGRLGSDFGTLGPTGSSPYNPTRIETQIRN